MFQKTLRPRNLVPGAVFAEEEKLFCNYFVMIGACFYENF